MKNRLLEVLVCGFSFLFTGYFVAAIFALFSALIGPGVRNNFLHYPIILMPFPIGIYAGVCSAKAALKLERKRQEDVQQKRLAKA